MRELSFIQEECWHRLQAAAPTGASNVVSAWRLSGPLDVARLERGVADLVRRHAVLSATFTNVGGARAAAVYRPAVDPAMTIVDLAGRTVAEREHETERLVDAAARAQFEVAAGPLWRVMLLRLATHEHALVVTLHPLVADKRSGRLFVQQLAAIYSASPAADRSRPPSGVQYFDFAAWQRERSRRSTFPDGGRQRTAGGPVRLERPSSCDVGHRVLPWPSAHRARVQSLARDERIEIKILMLGIVQMLLSLDHGGNDVVVAATSSDRTSGELVDTIGPFVRTLLIRTDLSCEPTCREALRRTQDAFCAAQACRDARCSVLERDAGLLVETQDDDDILVHFAGLNISPIDAVPHESRWELVLALTGKSDRFIGRLIYRRDRFSVTVIDRLAGRFERLLTQVAVNPDVRLTQIDRGDGGGR